MFNLLWLVCRLNQQKVIRVFKGSCFLALNPKNALQAIVKKINRPRSVVRIVLKLAQMLYMLLCAISFGLQNSRRFWIVMFQFFLNLISFILMTTKTVDHDYKVKETACFLFFYWVLAIPIKFFESIKNSCTRSNNMRFFLPFSAMNRIFYWLN